MFKRFFKKRSEQNQVNLKFIEKKTKCKKNSKGSCLDLRGGKEEPEQVNLISAMASADAATPKPVRRVPKYANLNSFFKTSLATLEEIEDLPESDVMDKACNAEKATQVNWADDCAKTAKKTAKNIAKPVKKQKTKKFCIMI